MHPEKVISRGFRTRVRLPSGPPKREAYTTRCMLLFLTLTESNSRHRRRSPMFCLAKLGGEERGTSDEPYSRRGHRAHARAPIVEEIDKTISHEYGFAFLYSGATGTLKHKLKRTRYQIYLIIPFISETVLRTRRSPPMCPAVPLETYAE